jgi:hypothetical protein
MCQPDVGVRTLYWNPDNFSASASNNVDSECVDWTQLQIWAEERTFYAEDKLIIRPDGRSEIRLFLFTYALLVH